MQKPASRLLGLSIALCLIPTVAIRSAQAKETAVSTVSANQGSAAKVVLSDNVIVDGVPTAVIPRGDGEGIGLRNATFDSGRLAVDVDKRIAHDFVLVAYLKTNGGFLAVAMHTDADLVVTSVGKTMLGSRGHGIKGKGGKVTYQIQGSVPGVYVLSGSGTLYLFALDATAAPKEAFPCKRTAGEACMAASNVIELRYNF